MCKQNSHQRAIFVIHSFMHPFTHSINTTESYLGTKAKKAMVYNPPA